MSSPLASGSVIVDIGSSLIRAGYAGDPRPRCASPAPSDAARGDAGTHADALAPILSDLLLGGLLCGQSHGGLRVTVLDRGDEAADPAARRAVAEALLVRLGGGAPDRGRILVGAVRFLPGIVMPTYLSRVPAETQAISQFLLSCKVKIDAGVVSLVVDWGARDVRAAIVYNGGGEGGGEGGVSSAAVVGGTYCVCPMGFESMMARLSRHLPAYTAGEAQCSRSDAVEIFRSVTSAMLSGGALSPACDNVAGLFDEKKEAALGPYPVDLPHAGLLRVPVQPAPVLDLYAAMLDADDADSLPNLILDVLQACPRDLRRAAAQNIVLAGGGAAAVADAGIDPAASLAGAVRRTSARADRVKVRACAAGATVRTTPPFGMDEAVWVGASVADGAGVFPDAGWVTRADLKPP